VLYTAENSILVNIKLKARERSRKRMIEILLCQLGFQVGGFFQLGQLYIFQFQILKQQDV